MSTLNIFVDNPNIIVVSGLHAHDNPATFINDATATCTVTDADGTEITGETWPLAMDYVSDSDGQYTAELVSTLPWVANTEFFIVINITDTNDRTGQWTIPVRPKRRDAP